MNLTKTKKIVAAGLSALMMMCSATPVFAAESGCGDDLSWLEPGYNGPSGCVWPSGGSGDKSANLNYQVSSSYDWIIHSSIDFGADAGVKHTVDRTGNQVKVLKNVIPEGKYLNISVKGSGANDAFTVDNGGNEVLNYDVSDDNGAVGVNGNVLSVPAGTNTATQNMNFKLNTRKTGAEVAGQYDGQVIYNAELGGKDDIIQKEKSSKLITGGEFNKKIPSEATTVVFTSEKAPKGATTTDLTVAKDGDVVGWLDGTTWKVSTQDSSKVVNFNQYSSGMFYYKKSLTNIDFNNVDTSNVTNMREMFDGCSKLTSLDLSNFDTSNVTYMYAMFLDCSNLTSLDLSGFNTSNVTNMSNMFDHCSQLTSLDLGSFNTSNVTYMREMFDSCRNLTSLNLSSFDTSNVTNIYGMFHACANLTSLDLNSFDTSNVTDMHGMFLGCSNLTSLDLSGFNTSNVTNMSNMFDGCSKLPFLDLSSFNTSNVKSMSYMFSGCSKLTSLDLSSLDTSNVTYMRGMFIGCSNLASVDLSGFDTSSVTDMSYLFRECSNLTNIYASPRWSTKNIKDGENMFENCEKLPNYNASVINITKAHTGPGGYLTLKQ